MASLVITHICPQRGNPAQRVRNVIKSTVGLRKIGSVSPTKMSARAFGTISRVNFSFSHQGNVVGRNSSPEYQP